jgi:hypothetical protein
LFGFYFYFLGKKYINLYFYFLADHDDSLPKQRSIDLGEGRITPTGKIISVVGLMKDKKRKDFSE